MDVHPTKNGIFIGIDPSPYLKIQDGVELFMVQEGLMDIDGEFMKQMEFDDLKWVLTMMSWVNIDEWLNV